MSTSSHSENPYLPPKSTDPAAPERAEDPVLVSARREAIIALTIWLLACVYSMTVCYRLGYWRDAATLTYVFGFPDWVFWGVVVPWSICTALCFILAYFVIKDEDLGAEQVEEALTEGADRV